MIKHEEKQCPRCTKPFECKVGDIANCQCFGITFITEEKKFIEERYHACLCRTCLLKLNSAMCFSKKNISIINDVKIITV